MRNFRRCPQQRRATLPFVKNSRSRPGKATATRRAAAGVVVALAGAPGIGVAGAAPTAVAFEPSTEVRHAAVALVQQAASAMAPPGARVVARPGALDARLKLAPCARVEPFLVAGQPAWGATRVGLRCTEGALRWRVFLPVQVQVLAPAWTSKAALPAGATLSAEQWELTDVDWAAAPSLPLGAGRVVAGRTLARPVEPGQALRESDLAARRWFNSGQAVRIVAAGRGYQVSGEGLALGHGIEGQPVRVRTEGGRIVTGQPVGDSLVEVRL
ncbi:MAG: flagellar basal body P-ring formation protein FlgA [Rubrivivax sp.]|nr:flagellar basal body P-ring formation protein FlgA [Rubrivivax sp.]